MIVMTVTWLGRCCPNTDTDVENTDAGFYDSGRVEYRKLMTKLVRRYIDDQDEFADDAFRIQFERLTKDVKELKTYIKAGLNMKHIQQTKE